MARLKLDLQGDAYRKVLGFIFAPLAHQPWRVAAMFAAVHAGDGRRRADAALCRPAGRRRGRRRGDDGALNAAIVGVRRPDRARPRRRASCASSPSWRSSAFTLKMMADIAQDAFHRVQRFSTDWHANTFAGSTVRKVTRGMWGIDMLNDALIILLFPSLVMLVGTSILLGLIWPLMGARRRASARCSISRVTVALSVGYVSPAASLANAWDTRMGGALADAISCNAVVKGFGAEDREEERLSHVVGKWRTRTARTWQRGTLNGGIQGAMLIAAAHRHRRRRASCSGSRASPRPATSRWC